LSLNHKRAVEAGKVVPGGKAPRWLRYLSLGITIAALSLMFWESVGKHPSTNLHTRVPSPVTKKQEIKHDSTQDATNKSEVTTNQATQ